jgi:hypothetical protein
MIWKWIYQSSDASGFSTSGKFFGYRMPIEHETPESDGALVQMGFNLTVLSLRNVS